ncbi:MAG: hypothetical protein AAF696_11095 [Bacteroidota bacterium]
MKFHNSPLPYLLFCLSFFLNLSSLSACLCEYIPFYRATSHAEILIADQKYEEAYELYLKTFESFRGFEHDYQNATLLAAKLKDTSAFFTLARKALQAGQKFRWMEKTEAFSAYKSLADWAKLKEEALIIEEESYRMSELDKELEKIFKKDQRMRNFPFTLRWNNKFIFDKMWDRVDSTNYYRVKEIIHTHGFPSEKVVGRFEKAWTSRAATYIMVHNHYIDPDTGFQATLYQEMCKGNLHAIDYAWIIDRRVRIEKETEHYATLFTRSVYKPNMSFSEFPSPFDTWDEKKLEDVNRMRASIGLIRVEEAYKRMKLLGNFNFKF